MNSEIINISWWNVAITTIMVIAAGICSLYLKLRLERDILIGTIRAFIQLFLLGYILKFVFALNSPFFVLILFLNG